MVKRDSLELSELMEESKGEQCNGRFCTLFGNEGNEQEG